MAALPDGRLAGQKTSILADFKSSWPERIFLADLKKWLFSGRFH
jgi:hypothetical protein